MSIIPKELACTCTIAAPRMAVWRCWTEPELFMSGFAHVVGEPLKRVDLHCGGEFYTKMRGPNGEDRSGEPGIWLDIVHGKKLVFTETL